MGGKLLISQAGNLYLFGPANCTGEHLIENTGSIIRLAWFPIAKTAVECPIQVYVIVLSDVEKIGLTIGNNF